MVRRSVNRKPGLLLLFAGSMLATACGSSIRSNASAAARPTPPQEPVARPVVQAVSELPAAPTPDPVLVLIDTSDHFFQAGQRELELGHVGAARQQFDRAVNVLLESPYGGR